MSLSTILGTAVEKSINAWVRGFGRSLNPDDYPWLKCPVGSATAVGTEMYNDIAAAESLHQNSSPRAGLLYSFDDLRSDRFDSTKIDRRIRDFYEHTAAYDLDAWSQVGALAKPLLWGLVTLVSRRMDQLVFPLSPLELSGGMSNEIVEMTDRAGRRVYTGWRRTLVRKNSIIYAGLYSTAVPPNYGRPCVRVTFPVRRGSAAVILRPEVGENGSLKLIAEGRKFGDPGFYRIVKTGPSRCAVRYIPQLRERFHVYVAPDGILRTEHNIRMLGTPVVSLHYKMPAAKGAMVSA
ncbi:MAG TPA: hypothetical protein VKW06_01020 [Candidatus Angelobacter sp.]|nr:hypothetical protein [Candidatus Angelobacter sp.]